MFWFREKNNLTLAFRYAKQATTENMVKKYGGSLVASPQMPENAPSGDIMSVLTNSEPQTEAAAITSGDFKVMVQTADGSWTEHSSSATITEANTTAKEIIKFYSAVVVVKQ
jgi:hypothetical protein